MSNNSSSDESAMSPDSESSANGAVAAAAVAVMEASVPVQHEPDTDDPYGVEENDRNADDPDGAIVDSEQKIPAASPLPAIPVVPLLHALADRKLHDSLDSVDPQNLSEEERQMTDANILALNTNQCKDLCRKLPHFVKKTNNLVSAKRSVSMTGSKNDMIARLLSWFFKLRGQSADEERRPTVDGTAFSESEDARLIEIMTSNELYPMIEGAFMSGTRLQIDAADARTGNGGGRQKWWRTAVVSG